MKPWLCMLALTLPAAARADAPSTPWSQRHPAAFASLAAWVQQNPEAARQAFWWDRQHPRRAETFLRWIVEKPTETLDAFASAHQDWPAVDEVLHPSHAAFEGLIAWGRAHPAALQELSSRERSFSRIGFNELAELWQKPRAAQPPPQGAP
ncbi:MAG TPA: hypothetical protein VMB50_07120 [Myxococcales bacterium]|nr:hypothetical protein [Myxococcales bacterium]